MTWAAHVGMLSGFKHISFVYPGLSLRFNPGIKILNNHLTLKGFANRLTPSGFNLFHIAFPGLSLRSNPGLELANAFGVTGICAPTHYHPPGALHQTKKW